jgi:hypothetical protein
VLATRLDQRKTLDTKSLIHLVHVLTFICIITCEANFFDLGLRKLTSGNVVFDCCNVATMHGNVTIEFQFST